MTSITLHFQADSWTEIATQMHAALGLDRPTQPSTADDFPDDVEGAAAPDPDPIPEPDPVPARPPKATTRKPRSTQSATPAAPAEPEPEIDALGVGVKLEPEKPPRADLPSIEALKAIVTQAVRKAQKKEGPDKILELLPEFKAKTGLGFVMEAEERHRDALANLIETAGLASATA